jgi:hypothetical protein
MDLAEQDGGWLVQMISTFLQSLPAELPEWIAVGAVVAVLAFLLSAIGARKRRETPRKAKVVSAKPVPVEKAPSRPERALEAPSGTQGLQSMQARAAEQIDAAEHALNRLLAECEGIANLPVEPTLTPERELKPEAKTPARPSLAA